MKKNNFLVGDKLSGKVPHILEMLLSSVIVPYIIGLPLIYLILKGMDKYSYEDGLDSRGTFLNDDGALRVSGLFKAFAVQEGFSMPVIVISTIILNILGHGPSGISKEEIFGEYWWYYLIILLGFAPIIEECLFRKILLDRLLVIGVKPGIIISAILFALPHVISQGIPQMFGTFIIGLVWAYVRVKTGKLWPGIILHIMFNLYGSYFSLFMGSTIPTTMLLMLINVIILPVLAVIISIRYTSKDISQVETRVK